MFYSFTHSFIHGAGAKIINIQDTINKVIQRLITKKTRDLSFVKSIGSIDFRKDHQKRF